MIDPPNPFSAIAISEADVAATRAASSIGVPVGSGCSSCFALAAQWFKDTMNRIQILATTTYIDGKAVDCNAVGVRLSRTHKSCQRAGSGASRKNA
jgi:bacterioferritin-associated ferredoxin